MTIQKKRDKILSRIVTIVGIALPIIPIVLLITYFYLPKSADPYVIDLKGNWEIRTKHTNAVVKFPDYLKNHNIFTTDDKPLLYYVASKSIELKPNMKNKDLQLIISGTFIQTGKVYFNDSLVGLIGIKKSNMRSGCIQGSDSFVVSKSLIKSKNNVIKLNIVSSDVYTAGLSDPRLYIGLPEYLKLYFDNGDFLTKFFGYGIIYFNILMIVILVLLIFNEWRTDNRNKYISVAFYILSIIIYNVVFLGTFVSSWLDQFWMGSLYTTVVTIYVWANIEFIQAYYLGKTNIVGKIHRIICSLTLALEIIFFSNDIIIGQIYLVFSYYILTSFVYSVIVGIKSTISKKVKYGGVILVSIVLTLITAISDMLTNQGYVYLPMLFNIATSCVGIIASIIVLADFINMSTRNKKMSSILLKANDNLKSMYREMKEKKSMEFELDLAGKIQKTLLLNEFPKSDSFEFFGNSIAAKKMGGDYYDIIQYEKDKYLFTIADVMGKGTSAALVMVKIQTLLKVLSCNNSLKDMATRLNNEIVEDLKGEKFVTIIIGTYDAITREVQIMNFGHDPFYLYNYEQNTITLYEDEIKCMPIGIVKNLELPKICKITLSPKDKILMFTDGVIEAMNKDHDQFGIERLEEVFKIFGNKNPIDIYNNTIECLNQFRGDYIQNDDITLLILESK